MSVEGVASIASLPVLFVLWRTAFLVEPEGTVQQTVGTELEVFASSVLGCSSPFNYSVRRLRSSVGGVVVGYLLEPISTTVTNFDVIR